MSTSSLFLMQSKLPIYTVRPLEFDMHGGAKEQFPEHYDTRIPGKKTGCSSA